MCLLWSEVPEVALAHRGLQRRRSHTATAAWRLNMHCLHGHPPAKCPTAGLQTAP